MSVKLTPVFIFFIFVSAAYAQDACELNISGPNPKQDIGGEIVRRYMFLVGSGLNNFTIETAGGPSDATAPVFSIFYPVSSIDPKSAVVRGVPVGGVSSKILLDHGYDCLFLTYDVKFKYGFDFVKGGKLPGLAGGTANTGGKIPNGYDGFSARFLWLGGGGGAVYAYLPTSKVWGTALGPYKWKFKPDQWHTLTQKIVLNDVGKSNGVLKVWFDNVLVHQENDILYRRSDKVKIDSFLFSSFFGGNSPDFAATADSYVYLRDIKISECL